MLKQINKHDLYAREKRFVDISNEIAQTAQNGEMVLWAYNRYSTLAEFSKRCKSGDLEARKLWDELPEKVREFWPALNYLNQERGQ
jgi:hypothetical protein